MAADKADEASQGNATADTEALSSSSPNPANENGIAPPESLKSPKIKSPKKKGKSSVSSKMKSPKPRSPRSPKSKKDGISASAMNLPSLLDEEKTTKSPRRRSEPAIGSPATKEKEKIKKSNSGEKLKKTKKEGGETRKSKKKSSSSKRSTSSSTKRSKKSTSTSTSKKSSKKSSKKKKKQSTDTNASPEKIQSKLDKVEAIMDRLTKEQGESAFTTDRFTLLLEKQEKYQKQLKKAFEKSLLAEPPTKVGSFGTLLERSQEPPGEKVAEGDQKPQQPPALLQENKEGKGIIRVPSKALSAMNNSPTKSRPRARFASNCHPLTILKEKSINTSFVAPPAQTRGSVALKAIKGTKSMRSVRTVQPKKSDKVSAPRLRELQSIYRPKAFVKTAQDLSIIRGVLSRNFVFKRVRDLSLEQLLHAFEPMEDLPKDFVVINRGDVGQYFYILGQGSVVFEEMPAGSKNRIADKEGASFGMLAVLYKNPCKHTVRVNEDHTRIYRVDQVTFRYILQSRSKEKALAMQAVTKVKAVNRLLSLLDTEAKSRRILSLQSESDSDDESTEEDEDDDDNEKVELEKVVEEEQSSPSMQPRPSPPAPPGMSASWSEQRSPPPPITPGASPAMSRPGRQQSTGLMPSLASRPSRMVSSGLQRVSNFRKIESPDAGGSSLPPLREDVKADEKVDDKPEEPPQEGSGEITFDMELKDSSDNEKTEDEDELSLALEEVANEDADNYLQDDDDEYKKYMEELEGSRRSLRNTLRGDESTEFNLDLFKMNKVLGEGQFGEVWLVQPTLEEINEEEFALKIQRKNDENRSSEYTVEEAINRECRVLEKLCHPFIVDFVQSFEDVDNIYLVMGLIKGVELWDCIHRELDDGEWVSGIPEDHAKFYGLLLADTLYYMHRQQICHRDIKPENVMVGHTGYPVLVDFGFAKELPDNKTFTMCGTPKYTAPELISVEGHGCEVDNWSLGVVIYEMISGGNPFWYDDISDLQLLEDICTCKPYPIQDDEVECSVDAKDLIFKLLDKDPETRPFGKAITSHKWFDSIDLNKARRMELPAPWAPGS